MSFIKNELVILKVSTWIKILAYKKLLIRFRIEYDETNLAGDRHLDLLCGADEDELLWAPCGEESVV